MTFKDVAGVTHKYSSLRIEFHTPSEHILDGVNSDLEMQVIHQKVNSTKLAIVSFLFSIVEEDIEWNIKWNLLSNDDGDVVYIPDPWAS